MGPLHFHTLSMSLQHTSKQLKIQLHFLQGLYHVHKDLKGSLETFLAMKKNGYKPISKMLSCVNLRNRNERLLLCFLLQCPEVPTFATLDHCFLNLSPHATHRKA